MTQRLLLVQVCLRRSPGAGRGPGQPQEAPGRHTGPQTQKSKFAYKAVFLFGKMVLFIRFVMSLFLIKSFRLETIPKIAIAVLIHALQT